jgi:hypothetical protein
MRYFIRSSDGTWDLGSVEAEDKTEAAKLVLPVFGLIKKSRIKTTRAAR